MPPIKTQLQSRLDKILTKNQAHFEDEKFIQAVQSLKTVVDSHYQLNDRGMMRPLFAFERDQLSDQYLNLIKIANNTITDKDAPKDKVEAYTLLRSILEKDLSQLSAMQPDGVHSLAELVGEQNQVVTISDSKLSTEGGALSSRIPVSIKQNGQEIQGFFTKADHLMEIQQVLASIDNVKTQNPELGEVIDTLFKDKSTSNKCYLINIGNKLNLDEVTLGDAEGFLISAHRAAENWNNDQRMAALGCLQIIAAPFNEKTMMRVSAYSGNLGIEPGARVDSRNSAMSLVANMLGQPELLARSKPLTVVHNGQIVEGTFMELAKGSQRTHISKNDPIRNCSRKSYNNAQLLKSIADLQIVDFLCCNVDRHGGNLTYIVDSSDPNDPKVTGVQGIDNDMSFGVRPMGGDKVFFDGTTPFNDILVISRSMADKVLNMDAEKYFHSLRGQGLERDACEAAARRLNTLKEKIRDGEEYFKDKKDPKHLKRGQLRVVSDNEWEKIGLGNLASTAQHGNVFSRTDHFRRIVSRVPSAGSFKYAQGTVAKPLDTTQLTLTLKAMLKIVNDQNPILIRSSNEYTAMRSRLGNLTEFLEATGSPLSDKDYLRVRKSLEQLRGASEEYLKYKEKDQKPSGLAQRRMAAATDVQESIGTLLKALDAAYQATDADEIESFNTQMKAEAQRLYNLNEAGKTAQIDLNKLAKEKPQDFARKQSEAALATLKSQLTNSSEPILQQFPNADRLAAQVLMHSMVNEIEPPMNNAVLSAMCVQRLTVENTLCRTPALRNLLTRSPEQFIAVLEDPDNRLKLATLSMKQLNTVDRNRNVVPTAKKAAAQIEAEANAPKLQAPVMR